MNKNAIAECAKVVWSQVESGAVSWTTYGRDAYSYDRVIVNEHVKSYPGRLTMKYKIASKRTSNDDFEFSRRFSQQSFLQELALVKELSQRYERLYEVLI